MTTEAETAALKAQVNTSELAGEVKDTAVTALRILPLQMAADAIVDACEREPALYALVYERLAGLAQ